MTNSGKKIIRTMYFYFVSSRNVSTEWKNVFMYVITILLFRICYHKAIFHKPEIETKEGEIENSWFRVQVTFLSHLFPFPFRYATHCSAFFTHRIDTFVELNSVLIYDAQASKIIWGLLKY